MADGLDAAKKNVATLRPNSLEHGLANEVLLALHPERPGCRAAGLQIRQAATGTVIVTALICPLCSKPFPREAFLAAVSGYSTSTDSGSSSCPECHAALEFRVRPGCLELGYTYWAGSLHFESVSSFRIAGLRLISTAGSLSAGIKGAVFPLSPPRPPSAS